MFRRSVYSRAVLAALILTLTACGKSADEASQPSPAASPSAPPAQPSSGTPAPQPVAASTLSAATVSAAKSVAHCSLDTLGGETSQTNPVTVKAGQTIIAGGWLVNSGLQPPPQFTLVLQGSDVYGFDGVTGVARADVAKALNTEAAGQSGFNVAANLGSIPAGTYKVLALIKINGQDGNEICDMQHQLTIGG
ncbi:hypothetical protein [Rhodanobacter umsongensis]